MLSVLSVQWSEWNRHLFSDAHESLNEIPNYLISHCLNSGFAVPLYGKWVFFSSRYRKVCYCYCARAILTSSCSQLVHTQVHGHLRYISGIKLKAMHVQLSTHSSTCTNSSLISLFVKVCLPVNNMLLACSSQ